LLSAYLPNSHMSIAHITKWRPPAESPNDWASSALSRPATPPGYAGRYPPLSVAVSSISCLEDGYALNQLARSATAHVRRTARR
jgi:hypothetical protein